MVNSTYLALIDTAARAESAPVADTETVEFLIRRRFATSMSIPPTATPSGTSPEFISIFALFWRIRLPASMSIEPTAMLLF